MMRPIAGVVSAVLLSGVLVSPAPAVPPPPSVDDRIAQSDLVVVAEVAGIDDDLGTLKVSRALKGPADLKELTVAGVREKAAPMPGPIQAVRQGGAATFSVGETLLWTLRKRPADAEAGAKVVYENVCTYWKERPDRADEVAAIIAALADPAAALKDAKTSPRARLSAANVLLRRAVTEIGLPGIGADRSVLDDPEKLRAQTGYVLLDPAAANAAVEAALALFPGKTLGPGDGMLVWTPLQNLGCPVRELKPPEPQKRMLTEDDLRRMDAQWTAAVRQWWDRSREKLRLYLPKDEAARLGLDRKATAPAAGPWKPVLEKADRNRPAEGETREFSGTLVFVPEGGPSIIMRHNPYRLKMADRTLDVYVGASHELKPYVGKKVTLRGAYREMELEGTTCREIWPVAIRLDE